jgi:ribosome maturation factor RimP
VSRSTTYDRERKLQREVSETVSLAAPDVEVLALELSAPDRFCVYIDHERGVDHALCERVTNALRGYLDRYAIDVSSPGIERPVRTRAHFAAAAGKPVSLRTNEQLDGRKRFKGRVVEAGDAAVLLEQSGEEIEIPYERIVRGNLVDEGR